MDVTFKRTGVRRYGVLVQRSGWPPVVMDPAPGYHPALPHDAIHFVVEEMLGLSRGVFGQLAEGGDAGTFHLPAPSSGSRERTRVQRHTKRRGARLVREGQDETALSERAASICHHAWLARSSSPEHRREAEQLAPYIEKMWAACSAVERRMLSADLIQRVCDRLDALSARWSCLEVGGCLALQWQSLDSDSIGQGQTPSHSRKGR